MLLLGELCWLILHPTPQDVKPLAVALPAQLTRKGSALLRRAEAAVASSDEHLLAHLSPADRRQLKLLLYRAGNPSPENSSVCAPSDGAG